MTSPVLDPRYSCSPHLGRVCGATTTQKEGSMPKGETPVVFVSFVEEPNPSMACSTCGAPGTWMVR